MGMGRQASAANGWRDRLEIVNKSPALQYEHEYELVSASYAVNTVTGKIIAHKNASFEGRKCVVLRQIKTIASQQIRYLSNLFAISIENVLNTCWLWVFSAPTLVGAWVVQVIWLIWLIWLVVLARKPVSRRSWHPKLPVSGSVRIHIWLVYIHICMLYVLWGNSANFGSCLCACKVNVDIIPHHSPYGNGLLHWPTHALANKEATEPLFHKYSWLWWCIVHGIYAHTYICKRQDDLGSLCFWECMQQVQGRAYWHSSRTND